MSGSYNPLRRESELSLLQAAVLGLVQGLTEFLPISSSAHLILTSRYLGWADQGLHFDMAANSGSLLAVIVYFRHELTRLARAGAGSLGLSSGGADAVTARLTWQLAAATLPVAVAGLLLQDIVAGLGRQDLVIATTTVVFGLLLGWADLTGRRDRTIENAGWRRTFAIGVAQALALMPGTSRSGVTITAGRFAGLGRQDAARFSFLLAVPVGLLVAVKDLFDAAGGAAAGTAGPAATAIGFLVSGVSAYAAIHWLLAWVRRQSLMVFAVYRLLLGAVLLAAVWL